MWCVKVSWCWLVQARVAELSFNRPCLMLLLLLLLSIRFTAILHQRHHHTAITRLATSSHTAHRTPSATPFSTAFHSTLTPHGSPHRVTFTSTHSLSLQLTHTTRSRLHGLFRSRGAGTDNFTRRLPHRHASIIGRSHTTARRYTCRNNKCHSHPHHRPDTSHLSRQHPPHPTHRPPAPPPQKPTPTGASAPAPVPPASAPAAGRPAFPPLDVPSVSAVHRRILLHALFQLVKPAAQLCDLHLGHPAQLLTYQARPFISCFSRPGSLPFSRAVEPDPSHRPTCTPRPTTCSPPPTPPSCTPAYTHYASQPTPALQPAHARHHPRLPPPLLRQAVDHALRAGSRSPCCDPSCCASCWCSCRPRSSHSRAAYSDDDQVSVLAFKFATYGQVSERHLLERHAVRADARHGHPQPPRSGGTACSSHLSVRGGLYRHGLRQVVCRCTPVTGTSTAAAASPTSPPSTATT